MTKAQAVRGFASGFVDPVVIQPLPTVVAGNPAHRSARNTGRKLDEAERNAASQTPAFRLSPSAAVISRIGHAVIAGSGGVRLSNSV
jgi:hypothetical protein